MRVGSQSSTDTPRRCRAVLLAVLVLAGAAAAAQWTVAVYMCADNGLNDKAYEDLAEMMAVGSTEEVRVVVQVDNVANDTHPGCRRYRVEREGLVPLGELGEVDMADTATLSAFGRFVQREYPADNYFFVLWDHGTGWTEGYGPTRSMFIDESHGHAMGVAGGELGAAMAAIRASLGRRIRVLGFDACLMGMIEVGCEVVDACDYIVGSEGVTPADGWPYDEVFGLLVARPTATPEEFLPQACAAYVGEYPGLDVSLSAIDARQLERVLPIMRATLADSVTPSAPGFAEARSGVQTFAPTTSRPPCESDDQVDLLHYWELAPGEGTGAQRAALVPLVVAHQAGGRLDDARGVAVWFPDNYLGFKWQAESYAGLAFEDSVGWLSFLNRYFDDDDVRPTQTRFSDHRLGGRGDLRLWWNRSYDIAPVCYRLHEAVNPVKVLDDPGDDFEDWSAVGWTTSEAYSHSPPTAFFSGSAPNLDNQLVLFRPAELAAGGLLSCYFLYHTEEDFDSTGGFKRDICHVEWCGGAPWEWQPLDSLYGTGFAWEERRYVLPPSAQCYLRFRYVSDGTQDRLGVYLDDIEITAFDEMRIAGDGIADTTCYLFNVPRDDYWYVVTAFDEYGNASSASQFYPTGEPVRVQTWAEPYTRPAPFAGECELWFDYPAGETVEVSVFTLSGTLVRKFEDVDAEYVDWDGCNAAGKPLADGVYLVVVRGEGFRKLGKIARVTTGQ